MFEEIDGVIKEINPQEITQYTKKVGVQFWNKRDVLGKFISPDYLGELLLLERPKATRIIILIKVNQLDARSATLKTRETEYVYVP